MATNMINNLRANLLDGLRTTKYEVQITNASGAGTVTDATLMAKATSFPAKSIGQVEVWSQGRKVMLQGDTEFEHTWDVTFYEDEAHTLRSGFLAWQKEIDDADGNTHVNNSSSSAKVLQLSSNGNESTKSYNFINIWPQSVSSIEMSDESVNTVGEFTVTFSFDSWADEDSATSATTAS